jgi:23S rRNA maturation mini-RNase III
MDTPVRDLDAKALLVQQAWLGDAVLSLYVREKILREDGLLDGPKSVRMTSNQFLGTIGEPTKVEAEVGRIYQRGGLNAAFSWIETRIVPLFEKQELNRLRKSGR